MKRCIPVAIALAMPAIALCQKGAVAEAMIPSASGSGRHAWVYTPAGYPASCRPGCNLILAFDGAQYLGAMPLPDILDSLIAAKRTPATVAVLFDNGGPPARINDLANSQRFAAYIAGEPLPWTRAHYRVTHDAKRTIIAGSSAGGLGAAYVAFKYPGLFGNVLSQSGAFWRGNEASNAPPYEWLTDQFAKSPKRDLRFFLDVGSRETVGALGGAAPSLLDANRHLRAALDQKGYAVTYFEVPNGEHSPDTWRLRLPIAIATLAPMTNDK